MSEKIAKPLTKDMKVDRCAVCNGLRLNDNCMNNKCPMYAMSRNRRQALKNGLTATNLFTRHMDVVGMGRRKRAGV